MVEMRVFGLSIDARSNTPVVVLRAVEGETVLPVWVGAMEAMAISLVLNNESLPRPLTHDLLLSMLHALGGEVRRVEIRDFRQGIYYASLLLTGSGGRVRVDCRPSDAIALALRVDAPIMVSRAVLCLVAEAQRTARASASAPVPVPDAATDMMRRAGARKEADILGAVLRRRGALPSTSFRDEETRYRDLLRSLDPVSPRKM